MKRVLFTGYAPVHFVCFQPVYERLRRLPGVEVFLSGGREPGMEGDGDGLGPISARELYRPFRVPADRVLSLDTMRRQRFDMVFCAHVSGYFPREDRERVQIFHGLSFRNMAVRRDVLVYDHLFITGPYMQRAFQDQQLLRPADPRLVPIGFPKVDRLVDGSLNRGAILRRLGLPGRRPVLLYAPTGQRGNSLETLGEEVIRRLQASGRYDIVIKLHDHPRDNSVDWPTRLRPLLDRHTKLVRDFDIVPYLFVADLLISDASSVSSEYSLLDRPMVFIDVPEMIAAMQVKGRAVDLDTWGRKGGVTVRWPDEAVEAVRDSLAHPRRGSEVRRAMAQDLFFNPGRAAHAAVDWIRARLA
ncbi:MAG TPA: CDP-glycerol glycerophosphotransferase family protein [Gemmatimonadales bacterium]|nr:CDP-glycerol glycerophosphotransferase family protein [Gemmatimonadales bacterium]